MKESKKCQCCALPPHLRKLILRKHREFGSITKAYSWFQAEYPTAKILENTWKNHFRRHVEKSDYEELEIVPKEQAITPEEFNLVLYDKNKVALNVETELGTLYLAVLKNASRVAEKIEEIPKGHELFLAHVREARLLLDTIDKVKLKTVGEMKRQGMDLTSEDPTIIAAYEIDPEKGGKDDDHDIENG